jgi:hypothetical protein
MQELKECKCPECGLLLGKIDGTAELCCRGGKHKHDKTLLTFTNEKLIKSVSIERT